MVTFLTALYEVLFVSFITFPEFKAFMLMYCLHGTVQSYAFHNSLTGGPEAPIGPMAPVGPVSPLGPLGPRSPLAPG